MLLGAGFWSFPAALAASRETASGKGLSFAAGVLVLPALSDAALAASRETASGKGLSFAVAVLVLPALSDAALGPRPGKQLPERHFHLFRGCLGQVHPRRRGWRRRVLGVGRRLRLRGRLLLRLGRGRVGNRLPGIALGGSCACAEALAANVSRAANEATIVSLLRIVAASSLDLRLRPFHRAVVLKK